MDKLAEPRSYRFFTDQEAYLTERARSEGHRKKVLVLRRLVEEDMQRSKRGKHKEVA